MSFVTNEKSSLGSKEKKVSSTLELAKKLGLLNKEEEEKDKSAVNISENKSKEEDTIAKNNQELLDFILEDNSEAQVDNNTHKSSNTISIKDDNSLVDIEDKTNSTFIDDKVAEESNKSFEDIKPNEEAPIDNQDLIDFLLNDSSEIKNNLASNEQVIEIENRKNIKSDTKEENNKDSFISINVSEDEDKESLEILANSKKDKIKPNSITLLDDEKSDKNELIDFLLTDDEKEDEELANSDLTIVEDNTLDKKAPQSEDKSIQKDDIKEESITSKPKSPTDTKSNLNNGLLVTPEDIERYFASLESKESKLSKDIEQEELSDPKEFDVSKNIVENKPKTVSGSDVLAFQSFEFKGKAKEYFKIWIVNIALTIVTLGVYSAWAKVRNLRYIYGNTYLNNSNFEFNADPRRIFYGRAIVVLFYAIFLYSAKVLYNNTLALSIMGLFLLLLPWLIKQAVRFKLKSASYRNIRFKFHGKARSFYMLAFSSILAIVLVFSPMYINALAKKFGFEIPYYSYRVAVMSYMALFFSFLIIGVPLIYRKFKEIIINNSSYGNEMFKFYGTKRAAVGTFLKMAFTTALAAFLLALLVVIPKKFFGIDIVDAKHIDLNRLNSTTLIGAGIGILVYLASIGLYKGISDGFLSNYIRNNTKLGDGEFKTSIYPVKLGIISMVNIIAIVFSFGLLYPWAKMRYLKYKIENTQFACRDYNKFKAAKSKDVSAIGEEATDFFDIDLGV